MFNRVAQAYKNVFNSPGDGETVLLDLMKQCRILEPIIATGNPFMDGIQEGERRVVLMIMKKLRYDEAKLLKFIEEGNNDEQII